jgi:hypothetical protein
MSDTALGIAIGFAGGAVLTILGALTIAFLQGQRKRLGYEVLTAGVVIPELSPSTGIRVTVERSLVDPDASPGTEYLPVNKLYGFRVNIQNTGNVVLTGQRVSISLDSVAKIISVEIEHAPDLGGREIARSIDGKDRNICYATLPFLNPRQSVIVSVQSVDNAEDTCTISAGAEGLLSHDMAAEKRFFSNFLASAAVLLLLGTLAVTLASRFHSQWQDDTWTSGIVIGMMTTSNGLLLLALLVRRGGPRAVWKRFRDRNKELPVEGQ